MRTITYSVVDWTDEPEHRGYSIVVTETLHTVTGDEFDSYDIPGWYATREEAAKAKGELEASHAY